MTDAVLITDCHHSDVVVGGSLRASLTDYGGNNGNFGLLPTVLGGPAAAHKTVVDRGLTNMVGVGLTMEGIMTNWVTNEGLLEQGWRLTPQHGANWYEDWVEAFAHRRYGSNDDALVQAWKILTNRSEVSVYNGPRGQCDVGLLL